MADIALHLASPMLTSGKVKESWPHQPALMQRAGCTKMAFIGIALYDGSEGILGRQSVLSLSRAHSQGPVMQYICNHPSIDLPCSALYQSNMHPDQIQPHKMPDGQARSESCSSVQFSLRAAHTAGAQLNLPSPIHTLSGCIFCALSCC